MGDKIWPKYLQTICSGQGGSGWPNQICFFSSDGFPLVPFTSLWKNGPLKIVSWEKCTKVSLFNFLSPENSSLSQEEGRGSTNCNKQHCELYERVERAGRSGLRIVWNVGWHALLKSNSSDLWHLRQPHQMIAFAFPAMFPMHKRLQKFGSTCQKEFTLSFKQNWTW